MKCQHQGCEEKAAYRISQQGRESLFYCSDHAAKALGFPSAGVLQTDADDERTSEEK
jgi:hypothetical protein